MTHNTKSNKRRRRAKRSNRHNKNQTPNPQSKSSNNNTQNESKETNLECGICLEVVKIFGVIDCCQHPFCFECIKQWGVVANTCPLCKGRFSTISKRDPEANPKELESAEQEKISVEHKNPDFSGVDFYFNQRDFDLLAFRDNISSLLNPLTSFQIHFDFHLVENFGDDESDEAYLEEEADEEEEELDMDDEFENEVEQDDFEEDEVEEDILDPYEPNIECIDDWIEQDPFDDDFSLPEQNSDYIVEPELSDSEERQVEIKRKKKRTPKSSYSRYRKRNSGMRFGRKRASSSGGGFGRRIGMNSAQGRRNKRRSVFPNLGRRIIRN